MLARRDVTLGNAPSSQRPKETASLTIFPLVLPCCIFKPALFLQGVSFGVRDQAHVPAVDIDHNGIQEVSVLKL